MLFGIKYKPSKAGLNAANEQLNSLGSAIFPKVGQSDLFFKSLVEAIKTANSLSKGNPKLHYSVFKLTKQQEKQVDEHQIVLSKAEYFQIKNERKLTELTKLDM